jgi:hypothetical protein
MVGWPGPQLASGVDWDGRWSDGVVAGDAWGPLAEQALRRLTGGLAEPGAAADGGGV